MDADTADDTGPFDRPPETPGWSLGVERPGRLAFFRRPPEPLADGGFSVDTLYSGLSAGTELSFVKGTNPAVTSGWDADLGIFDAARPGSGYPVRSLGYMEVGRVVTSRSAAVAVATAGLHPAARIAPRGDIADRGAA